MKEVCHFYTQDQKCNFNRGKTIHDTLEDNFTRRNTRSIIKKAVFKKAYFYLPCRLAIVGYFVRF